MHNFGGILCLLFIVCPFGQNSTSAFIMHWWGDVVGFDVDLEVIEDHTIYQSIVGGYPLFSIATHRLIFYKRHDEHKNEKIKSRHFFHFLLVKSNNSDEDEYRVVFFKVLDTRGSSGANIGLYWELETYKDLDNAEIALQKVLHEYAIVHKSGFSTMKNFSTPKAAIAFCIKKGGFVALVVGLHMIPILANISFEKWTLGGISVIQVAVGIAFSIEAVHNRNQRRNGEGGYSQSGIDARDVNQMEVFMTEYAQPRRLWQQALDYSCYDWTKNIWKGMYRSYSQKKTADATHSGVERK